MSSICPHPSPLPLSRKRGETSLLQDEEIAEHSPKSPYYISGIIYCIINDGVGIQIITYVLLLNSQRSKRPDNTFRYPMATVAMWWWVSATGIKRVFGSVSESVFVWVCQCESVSMRMSLCVSALVCVSFSDGLYVGLCVCLFVWEWLCVCVSVCECLCVCVCHCVSGRVGALAFLVECKGNYRCTKIPAYKCYYYY